MPVLVGYKKLSDVVNGETTDLDVTPAERILQDDLIIISLAQDGNRALDLTSQGFTEKKGTFGSTAETLRVFYRVAAADDETIPLIDLFNDDYILTSIVLRGVDTASPFGAEVEYSETVSTLEFPTIELTTTATYSTCLFFGVMDGDPISISSGLKQIVQEYIGAVGGCIGYRNVRGSGVDVFSKWWSSAADTWKIYGLEVMADQSSLVYPACTNDDIFTNTTVEPVNADVRDEFFASNAVFDDGQTPNVFTFDCSSTGLGISLQSGSLHVSLQDPRVYKLELISGTLNPELTGGNYYFVDRLTSTTFNLRNSLINGEFGTELDISLTTGTGEARLTEVGIVPISGRNHRPNGGNLSARNAFMLAESYASGQDFSNAYCFLQSRYNNAGAALGIRAFAVDTSNNWRSWYVREGATTNVDLEYYVVDFDSDFYLTGGSASTGNFDSSSVKTVGLAYLNTVTTARPAIRPYSSPYKISKKINVFGKDRAVNNGVTGNLEINDIIDSLPEGINYFTEKLADGIYSIGLPLEFGDGANDIVINEANGTLSLSPTYDGENFPDRSINPIDLTYQLQSGDVVNINTSQIKSSVPYGVYMNDTSSSLAETTFEGTTIINGKIKFNGKQFNDISFIDCSNWSLSGTTVSGSTLTNCAPFPYTSGEILVDSRVKDADNGIEFPVTGTYNIRDITLENNTNDLEITATTGTIDIYTKNPAPSFTTAGATVNLIPKTTEITFNNLTSANVQILDDGDVVVSRQINVTGSYTYITPQGASGTYKYCINREGYDPIIGTFSATGTDVVVDGTQAQKFLPDGASMYSGNSSVFLTVVPLSDGSRLNLRIGNGTVTARALFDEVEDALMTQDGMSYLIKGGGEISLALTPTGTYVFMENNVRLIRDNVGDSNATVEAFVQSTDNVVVDNVNGDVLFVTVPASQQLAEYQGFIWIDVVNGTDDGQYPFGTQAAPVKTWANAVQLSGTLGLTAIKVKGSLTLSESANNYLFYGEGTTSEIILNSQSIQDAYFENLKVTGTGTFGTGAQTFLCSLNAIVGFCGLANQCRLLNTLSIGPGDASFIFCSSAVAGTGRPTVTVTDSSTQMDMRNYSGGINIEGMVTGNNLSIDIHSGTIDLKNTCTGGTAVLRGDAVIVGRGNGIIITDYSSYEQVEKVKLKTNLIPALV